MSEPISPIEIEIFDGVFVDAGIARYVKQLNRLGYSTRMSCSGMRGDGHAKTNGNRPFILFDRPRISPLYNPEYFKVLATCFIKLNELEVYKFPNNPQYRTYWYLGFKPHKTTMPKNLSGLTVYLPFGLTDQRIHEKFKELVQILKKTDYFNKLSEKAIENGEEIIIAL